jgi:hypothetical protein
MLPKSSFIYTGRLIFDHLPKTAGMMVNYLLTKGLGSDIVTDTVNGEHNDLIRRYGGEHSVICGHVDFSFSNSLNPIYSYATIFREPVDRLLSHLFFILNNHDATQLPLLWPEVNDFIESDGELIGDNLFPFIDNPYLGHFSPISYINKDDSIDLAIDKVLITLQKYSVVGIYEILPNFLFEIGNFIGVSMDVDVPIINPTHSRPEKSAVSISLIKKISTILYADVELYRRIKVWKETSWRDSELSYFQNDAGKGILNKQGRTLTTHRIQALPSAKCDSRFSLLSVHMSDEGNIVPWQVLPFTLDFCLKTSVAELEIGIRIFDEDHRTAFGTNTTLLNKRLLNLKQGTHRVQYYLVVDLPEGAYTAGFSFAAPLPAGIRELAWFDNLVSFNVSIQRRQADVGYASMPVEVSYRQISDVVLGELKDCAGTVTVEAVLGSLACGEVVSLPVVLQNTSTQVWAGSYLNPLVLAYHWLAAEGTVYVFDGERTPLPSITVEPGKPLPASMRVVAPATPGQYRLALLPVQEGRVWFDQLGFTPTVLDVSVVSALQERHYQGGDARINTQCGRREGTVLAANGVEGFLLYGPYATLPAGHYEAHLDLVVMSNLSGAWLDVVGLGGATEYTRSHGSTFTPETQCIKLPFVLPEACADVEVRFWVPSGAQVSVHALHITPVVNYLKGEG